MAKPIQLQTFLQLVKNEMDDASATILFIQETANIQQGEDNPSIKFAINLPKDILKAFFFDSLKKLISEGVNMKDLQDFDEISDILIALTKKNKKQKPN